MGTFVSFSNSILPDLVIKVSYGKATPIFVKKRRILHNRMDRLIVLEAAHGFIS